MDVRAVSEAMEGAARQSEPVEARRFLLVYIAPGDGGIFVFRPGCGGVHRIGGPEATRSQFAESVRSLAANIWPEASKRTRQWLRIAADFLARSPLVKLAAVDDDDGDRTIASSPDRARLLEVPREDR